MIIDKIENLKIYENINPKLAKGLEYLKNTDFTKLENGRYEIEGDDIFAIVQEYHTKPLTEGKLEAHRIYTDIQFVVKGSEKIGYSETQPLTISEEYDEKRDLIFFNEKGDLIPLYCNYFAVFFPHDAHMPGIRINEEKADNVKKVVVKIKL